MLVRNAGQSWPGAGQGTDLGRCRALGWDTHVPPPLSLRAAGGELCFPALWALHPPVLAAAGTSLPRVTFVLFLSPGIISTFLHVHPFGASIEYICSYLQRLDSKVSQPPQRPVLAGGGGRAPWGEELPFLPGNAVGLGSRNQSALPGTICRESAREGLNFLRITGGFASGGPLTIIQWSKPIPAVGRTSHWSRLLKASQLWLSPCAAWR